MLIVNAPSTSKERKQFLGYEWSSAKGREGIKYEGGETVNDIINPLFDPQDLENGAKINTAIKRNFISEITDPLPEHCHYIKLTDMLNFSRVDFNKIIGLNPKQQINMINTGYEMKKLSEVVNIIRGVTYDKNEEVIGPTSNIILTADNITLEGTFVMKKQIFLSDSVKLDDEKRLMAGDIFICFSSGSKKHVGKTAYIKQNTEYYAGGFMGILRNKDINSLSKYVFELLNIDTYKNVIRNTSTGSNIQNLSSTLEGVKIPLPPLEVQKRIVDECEAVDQKTARAYEVITIAEETIKKSMQSVINAGHEMKKIGDVYKTASGGTPLSKKKEYYENGTIPWINSGEVSKKEINFADNFITELGLNNSNAKLFPPGTVLLAMYGATAGKVALLNIEASTNQALCALLPTEEMVPKFLVLVIESVYQYLLNLRTGVARDNLSQEKIKNIRIPVPPLNIQQQLAAEVEQLEAEITEAQAVIDNATERKNAILKKYL